MLHVADTLSHAHATNNSNQVDDNGTMELAIHQFVRHLPIADDQKEALRSATSSDRVLQQLMHILETGWPNNVVNVPQDVREYNEIHSAENLLFMGDRLIVPASKRSSVLQLIHEGHMGIERCKARARLCVYQR